MPNTITVCGIAVPSVYWV